MSNKDYTKYAKLNEAVTEENVTMPNVFVTGTTIEPVPENTTMPNIAVTPATDMYDEDGNDTVNPASATSEPEHKMGRVAGCTKLNVRKEPASDAEVVCTIYCHTEVEIDEAESTDDFYKIYTASGIKGFCMKTFINMK